VYGKGCLFTVEVEVVLQVSLRYFSLVDCLTHLSHLDSKGETFTVDT
jgi:hypothetical protein